MRDPRWRSHPVSHRGKRGDALIEASTRHSVLFRPVFLSGRWWDTLLRRYHPANGNCQPSPSNRCLTVPFRLPSSLVGGHGLTEILQPHPKPNLLPVDHRLVVSCVPVAPAKGRSVAFSQTCPNEYLILTWLPIAFDQYSMHNGACCSLVRRAHLSARGVHVHLITVGLEMVLPRPSASFSSGPVLLSTRFHLSNWSSASWKQLPDGNTSWGDWVRQWKMVAVIRPVFAFADLKTWIPSRCDFTLCAASFVCFAFGSLQTM